VAHVITQVLIDAKGLEPLDEVGGKSAICDQVERLEDATPGSGNLRPSEFTVLDAAAGADRRRALFHSRLFADSLGRRSTLRPAFPVYRTYLTSADPSPTTVR